MVAARRLMLSSLLVGFLSATLLRCGLWRSNSCRGASVVYLFIDESGTFTFADERNSWCTVAAYVAPEHRRGRIEALVKGLRAISGRAETKLKHLKEEQYCWFLSELSKVQGVAFAVAVDVGLHRREIIERHRDMQAETILRNRDKMVYETGRQAVTGLAEQVAALPPQLYTQLVCQVALVHRILHLGLVYFVQRHPPSLGHFRWRVDQKIPNGPTAYETTFQRLLPALLQSRSLEEPMPQLGGQDYRHFARFEYGPGEVPDYLKAEYGVDLEHEGGINIGKITSEDFKFVDSATTSGVQVADLIASGTARLLRGRFSESSKVATLLGSNFVQSARGTPLVQIISLDKSGTVDEPTSQLIRLMGKVAKRMLVRV